MKKTMLLLVVVCLLIGVHVFADVIIDTNDITTVTGGLTVQGNLSGPNIQRPLTSACSVGDYVRHIYPDGTVVCQSDTLGGLTCSTDQIAKWNGSAWECATSIFCPQGASSSCYTGTPGTSGIGVCEQGTSSCLNGAWGLCIGEIIDRTETCDGFDDDCDGQVDEGCIPPDGTPCGDGVCNEYLNGICVSSTGGVPGPGCSSPGTECSAADICDGAGSCQPNDLSNGTICGDPANTECTNPDTCDGNGICLPNHASPITACSAGTCDGNGVCQGI